jgi:hypothetical protein
MSLLVFAVYWPGRNGGFVFDDVHNLVENAKLHVGGLRLSDWVAASFSSNAGTFQRPLSMFTFVVNQYFTGLQPGPMKLTNVAIHIVNAWLVYALTRRLIRLGAQGVAESTSHWVALATATLWAVHPINLMAVLYIVQRMESLSHLFVFLGLLLYVDGRTDPKRGRGLARVLLGVVGCTVLGVLAKESAILLPLYALLLEVFVLRFRTTRRGFDKSLPILFAVVLLIPAIAGLFKVLPRVLDPAAFAARNFTLAQRLFTEAHVVLDYLTWTLAPNLRTLSLFHDDYPVARGLLDPPSTVFALLAIVGLAAMAWALRRRRPLAALGLAFFLGAHLLTGTVIPLELVFEHRNYFASYGLLLAGADLVLLLPAGTRFRTIGSALFLGFLAFCSGMTWLRADEWSNPLRFAQTEAEKHPDSPRATYNLANQYVVLTGYRPDSPFVHPAWVALDKARRAPGSNLLPEQASMIFAARIGAPQDPRWPVSIREKLLRQPLTSENRYSIIALNNCVVEGVCTFPKSDMLAMFGAALQNGPDAGMLSVYGKYALWVMHDPELALRLWRESAARGQRNPQLHVNLAMLAIHMGSFDEAQAEIDRVRASSMFDEYADDVLALEAALRRARASGEAVRTRPR